MIWRDIKFKYVQSMIQNIDKEIRYKINCDVIIIWYKKVKVNYCIECGKRLKLDSNYCSDCVKNFNFLYLKNNPDLITKSWGILIKSYIMSEISKEDEDKAKEFKKFFDKEMERQRREDEHFRNKVHPKVMETMSNYILISFGIILVLIVVGC